VSNVVLRLPSGVTLPCDVRVDTTASWVSDRVNVRVPRTVKDKEGHRHDWADSGHPTTVTEEIEPCDGACDDPEHVWQVYRCVQCRAEVRIPTTVREQSVCTGGTITYDIRSTLHSDMADVQALGAALTAEADLALVVTGPGGTEVTYPLTKACGPLDLRLMGPEYAGWSMRHTEPWFATSDAKGLH
jgi:hypothetical protein